jgi:hypothetical protein
MAALLKPDGILMANVIDSFKKGLFMPSYIRTLEEVFGKGNVHLVFHKPDYENAGISTCIIVASKQPLNMADFVAFTRGQKGAGMMSNVVPPERLRQYLTDRPSMLLTDDYVPVDNMIAPIFEERYGFKKNR